MLLFIKTRVIENQNVYQLVFRSNKIHVNLESTTP